VVPSSRWTEGSEAAVRDRFLERLGDAFAYEVVRVDDLPLAPSGKFQTIIPLEPRPTPPAPESATRRPGAAAGSG
jgi:hypothetical protein